MDNSLLLFSGNLVTMMRGALMMLFIALSGNLYPRRNENPILSFLFWILIIMIGMLLVSFGFMIEELKKNVVYFDLIKLLDMCLIPLIGGFLMTVVMPGCMNTRRSLTMLIPSIGFLIAYFFTQCSVLYEIAFIYTSLIALVAFSLTVIVSIRYDLHLRNNFSNIDNKTVGWVRMLVVLFTAWFLAWNFVIIHDHPLLDSIYYLFLITIWILIYRYSVKHITVVQTQELFGKGTIDETNHIHSEFANNKFTSTIIQYMDKERPWLNPSLTLQDLAIALKTNRTYLSEYFNKTLGTTFYGYLSHYRLRHACEILLTEPELSIIQVGEKSGFNSISTFRRAFEKHIGCSPAKFRRQEMTL